MTQAQPGKVRLCSLGAKGWEEPGKLGKDGKVLYHVIIADEANAGSSTHVWVNALDGTVMKTEKELPRKARSPKDNERLHTQITQIPPCVICGLRCFRFPRRRLPEVIH